MEWRQHLVPASNRPGGPGQENQRHQPCCHFAAEPKLEISYLSHNKKVPFVQTTVYWAVIYSQKHFQLITCVLGFLDPILTWGAGRQEGGVPIHTPHYQAILRHQPGWVSETSTQLWHYLPGDSIRFHRLKAQSHKACKPRPTSDTSPKPQAATNAGSNDLLLGFE